MTLIGADTHKHTHTLAAINTPGGQLLDERTTAASKAGFVELLDWARDLGDPERVWALEDCRHLTGPSSDTSPPPESASCASHQT